MTDESERYAIVVSSITLMPFLSLKGVSVKPIIMFEGGGGGGGGEIWLGYSLHVVENAAFAARGCIGCYFFCLPFFVPAGILYS